MNGYFRRVNLLCIHRHALPAILLLTAVPLLALSIACARKTEGPAAAEKGSSSPATPSGSAIDAAPIIERYRTLDNSRDSTIKMRATVTGNDGTGAPLQVQLTMYRKRQSDGSTLLLAEFTAPAEERDRDGLVTVFPDGRIEGVRYVQSTDSFIVTSDVMSEDALFGLTLQELADGQPEKYDYTIIREEAVDGTSCYRAEGRLKPGRESRFPRLVLLISKETGAPVQADFYDNQDRLARDLKVHKTEQIAGHFTRMHWTIDNRGRGKKIDFEAVDVTYDQNLKDAIFTREHLKKIASR
jgi:hypothetical protein